jgi:hypothetical protein
LLNALVALARPSFAGAILASQLLTLATLVGSAAVMDRIGVVSGSSELARFAALGTLAFMGPLFSETVNGMEMGLLTLAALVIVRRLYFEPGAATGLAAAVAVFVATRFEAAFYLPFLLAPLVARGRAREFVLWGAWGAAVFAVIAGLRWVAFDALLPNTVYAKMHAPYALEGLAARARIRAAAEVLALFAPALIILALLAAARRRGRRVGGAFPSELPLLMPVLGGAAFALITGPNWGYVGRMQLFTIPFVLLAVGRLTNAIAPRWYAARLALALAVAAPTVWSARVGLPIQSYRLSRTHEFGVTPMGFRETALAVERVRGALGEARVTFLTPDIGGSALCCPMIRFVDLGLLADKRLARVGYRALAELVEVERPEVIEAHAPWSALSGLYELEAFRSGYRPALVDRTRLYLRSDVADRLVATGSAEALALAAGAAETVGTDHRYAGYADALDDRAFASLGSVLRVR